MADVIRWIADGPTNPHDTSEPRQYTVVRYEDYQALALERDGLRERVEELERERRSAWADGWGAARGEWRQRAERAEAKVGEAYSDLEVLRMFVWDDLDDASPEDVVAVCKRALARLPDVEAEECSGPRIKILERAALADEEPKGPFERLIEAVPDFPKEPSDGE